jgi:hypothetical protein
MKKMFFSPKLWSEIAGTQWVGPSGAWNQRGKLRGNVQGAEAGAELCGKNYGLLRIFPFENHLSRGKWLISRICAVGGDARVREAGTYAVSSSKLHSMSRRAFYSVKTRRNQPGRQDLARKVELWPIHAKRVAVKQVISVCMNATTESALTPKDG